jgi:hypothetical protein
VVEMAPFTRWGLRRISSPPGVKVVRPSPRDNLILLFLCCVLAVAYLLHSGLEEILRIVLLLTCGVICFVRYRRSSR